MFKLKRLYLYIFMLMYIALSAIELIKYIKLDNTSLYGVYYLIINLVILFLIVPVVYNYKRNYSKARVSKIILIILLMLFNGLVLEHIVLNSINYMDASKLYVESLFFIKTVLKTLLCISLIVFIIFETKLNKKIISLIKKVD